ncbi:MAG: D-galactosaminyltransferase [Mycobacterium sp.]|nr:D-galactosaminyltransferase [Mycobacterium sp.]MDT5355500.1 D-galactosaminyltransferase [Mycobacterium sp.]
MTVAGAQMRPRRPEPGRPASHTSRVGLWFGTLIALFLLIAPGAIVARITQLTWPVAVAVGPALTYGVVALAIIPFGAVGIPWNGWTALAALAAVCLVMTGLRLLLTGYRDTEAEARGIGRLPALTVAAGVLLGALLIMWAAYRGIVHWQSIPSTWDAVWHANEVRFILDTGQASSTHMGELRNVETHQPLFYPSVFHALTAVFCQLTGAAPTTGYTLTSVAASVWLFPSSAAMLTWFLLRPRISEWRTAGAAATSAAMSASFTSVPYVEFGVAAMPNLAAYGVAIPTFVLITSTCKHRDRIPAAVLALVGILSVHLTGGFIVILFLMAWWLFDAWRHPVRGRLADILILALVAVPTALILAPQFTGVLHQADIIAGHAFPSFKSVKQGVIDALLLHTRHLNDFPTPYGLIMLSAIGMAILLYKRIWWPPVLWLVLTVATIYSGAPFHNPLGAAIEGFSQFFYNDPRRLSGVVTMLVTPMAGIAVFAMVLAAVALAKRLAQRLTKRFTRLPAAVWVSATVVLLVVTTVLTARHYLYRHLVLFGDKYDSVIIDQKDLDAMAYLASLPGARTTVIGDSNVDGTAWMYAVADLHPLWTHYDFPQQIGPGYYRFNFWAYADVDADPRGAEAVRALNIRYILTSIPTVKGFKVPDGLVSLDKSKSWAKIYDNGEARIYEWRGAPTTPKA